MKKIRVALIGGSGYTGLEALRLLRRHPAVELVGIFGPPEETGPIDGFHPILTKTVEIPQQPYHISKIADAADLAMLAVPHKVAMKYVPDLREAGIRVIDFSADYRLKDAKVYERWYCPHSDAERLKEAVYGLPEYYKDTIASANLVANPGCYPTCAILALAPIIKAGLIKPEGIIVNAISGITGAGRTPSPKQHYPRRNENFEPYAPGKHRHMPEMEEVLTEITDSKVEILFVPHLCPMDRGMLCTIYAVPNGEVDSDKLTQVLQEAYVNAPFVRVRHDALPATKDVATTNFCDLAVRVEKSRVILFSALDNLLKGASGQAVQNMNIMFGLDETVGLY
ncbi:MAG: N-acetyl-gamma-glutamyl-phosphate reductase [Planctomycetes bacterium]|nr:N-acetyl-gamma-glutamyl-phosphate reductase [Planctomycetota bacterium]